MITNWDIISSANVSESGRSFTLMIDGTENDARLIAKKLAGYCQAPQPAKPPFTYAFALPANLDETTLDKIRTAMQEGSEQANKVNQFVPGGSLGNPLFNTPQSNTPKPPTQVDINPADSFLKDKPAPPAPKAPQAPVEPVATPAEKPVTPADMPVNDQDMLIKDMEDTMLGKMPLEDIFAAETKYDMYLDLENKTLTKNPQKQSDEKMNNLADDVAEIDKAFDIFDQKIKDQTTIMDLADLQAVTSKLSQKDLGFMENADGGKNAEPSNENEKPNDFSVQSVQTGPEGSSEAAPEEEAHGTIPEETFLGNTIPPTSETDKTQNAADGLPDISVRGEVEDEHLEKTFNFETTLSTELMRTQYEKSFRTESIQVPQPVKPKPAKTPEPDPNLAQPLPRKPEEEINKILEAENTNPEFDPAQPLPLDATVSPETPVETKPVEPEIAAPEEESEAGKTTLRLRRKPPQAPQPAAPEEESEAGKTTLRLRRKPPQAPQPKAPASPGKRKLVLPAKQEPPAVLPPTAPVAPMPAATQPEVAMSASQPEPVATNDVPQPGLEKTRTIDYSIELPLSELKKHNWPLEVPLLPTYTLENFVLSVNRFAHATAISVIDNPGKLYNPLVFHGTTGTGKTHFLNAMAYGFSKKYGQENVFMTNGVRFSRGIQRYVMEGNIEKFEKFMESVKVLLIDDIHLLAINEQNRAHISKLLNKFLKEQKQIVITSKYPPESLGRLESLIQFKLDSGWISELKTTTGNSHLKIVRSMIANNGIDLTDEQINQFFSGTHITLSTIMRSIRRLKVLENLVAPHMEENQRTQAALFEKLLATTGEDPNSELLSKDPSSITSITTVGNGEWGRIGFFYPSNNSSAMNWMVYALEQRAKELGISGGFDIAVRSSYSTENIISSAFKIANLCDNKKLRGAVILGPSLTVCEPSVRENFYDILTHMLEIMLIRCGIINTETMRQPSTYVKVISELLR